MKNQSVRVLVAALAIVLAASLAGCGKAPQLTAEQLQAGVIGDPHPVSQADAMAKGCSCHTNQ